MTTISMLRRQAPAPAALSPAARKLTVRLALGSRMLSLDGHDDMNQGQISCRAAGMDAFLIKQALCGFCEAEPAEMLLASYDPAARADPLAPPELPLHQAIYAARPDVHAIVHTHAPNSLLFGATDWELEPISHDGACFAGRLGRFHGSSHTILDYPAGVQVAAALAGHAAVLLTNHGVVVVGATIPEAVVRALVLERACRLQIAARALGSPYAVASAADIARKQDYIFAPASLRVFWEFQLRQVRRAWPDIAAWNPS